MTKQTLLLLFGGPSAEHDVSIMSAKNVAQAVDTDKYRLELVYVDKQSDWWQADRVATQTELLCSDQQAQAADVAFPVMHGTYGEDGAVQARLEQLGIKYVGCGVEASRLCIDKVQAKQCLDENSIQTTPYVALSANQPRPQYRQLVDQLGSEHLFVKPANGGSSIGVSKLTAASQLDAALDLAFQYDDKLLIEKALVGREIEVAVLGNQPDLIVSTPGEIVAGAEFYDYQDKYADDRQSSIVIDPQLPASIAEQIKPVAAEVYRLLGCRGLARVDFILADDQTLYLNEVNTMPGFTNASMYPQLMQASGIDNRQLIDRLIELASL